MTDRISPAEWHGWHLEPGIPALTYQPKDFSRYEIDLHRMLRASDILSWIMQMHHKHWGDEVVTGLVTAVDDVLAPQRRIWSFDGGPDTPYTPETLRVRVDEFVAAWPDQLKKRFMDAPPKGYSGSSEIIQDWHKVIEADSRVAELAEVAYDLVRDGDEHTHYADAVYGDTKAYLARLVGWNRGAEPPVRRQGHIAELPDLMLPVISKPYAGPDVADDFLRSDRAYDVACDQISATLHDIYDQIWKRR